MWNSNEIRRGLEHCQQNTQHLQCIEFVYVAGRPRTRVYLTSALSAGPLYASMSKIAENWKEPRQLKDASKRTQQQIVYAIGI
jgi:hypothetical protein